MPGTDEQHDHSGHQNLIFPRQHWRLALLGVGFNLFSEGLARKLTSIDRAELAFDIGKIVKL